MNWSSCVCFGAGRLANAPHMRKPAAVLARPRNLVQRCPAELEERLGPHCEINDTAGELRGADEAVGERFLDDEGLEPDRTIERAAFQRLEAARQAAHLVVGAKGELALAERVF